MPDTDELGHAGGGLRLQDADRIPAVVNTPVGMRRPGNGGAKGPPGLTALPPA
jgi:hypothetical protein